MDSWLKEHLVCPEDHAELHLRNDTLVCTSGHTYPYIDDIPVMLPKDAQPTYERWCETYGEINGALAPAPATGPAEVDSFVQQAIVATNGMMYREILGKLNRYPIPRLDLPPGRGNRLLDIGCGWGRWSISAAQLGYFPVGIDPSLDAVRAARRVAEQLGVPAVFVVGDASRLPFAPKSFDMTFSYAVLQHFDKREFEQSLDEINRTLKDGGRCLIQMANGLGLRSRVRRALGRGRHPSARPASAGKGMSGIEYYRPHELARIFEDKIGPTSISADSYFALDGQISDVDILPLRKRLLVCCSAFLKGISRRIPRVVNLAEGVYITSTCRRVREP